MRPRQDRLPWLHALRHVEERQNERAVVGVWLRTWSVGGYGWNSLTKERDVPAPNDPVPLRGAASGCNAGHLAKNCSGAIVPYPRLPARTGRSNDVGVRDSARLQRQSLMDLRGVDGFEEALGQQWWRFSSRSRKRRMVLSSGLCRPSLRVLKISLGSLRQLLQGMKI